MEMLCDTANIKLVEHLNRIFNMVFEVYFKMKLYKVHGLSCSGIELLWISTGINQICYDNISGQLIKFVMTTLVTY